MTAHDNEIRRTLLGSAKDFRCRVSLDHLEGIGDAGVSQALLNFLNRNRGSRPVGRTGVGFFDMQEGNVGIDGPGEAKQKIEDARRGITSVDRDEKMVERLCLDSSPGLSGVRKGTDEECGDVTGSKNLLSHAPHDESRKTRSPMRTHGDQGDPFVLGNFEDTDCRMTVLDDPAGRDPVIDEFERSLPNVGIDFLGLTRDGEMKIRRIGGDDLEEEKLAGVPSQKASNMGKDRFGGFRTIQGNQDSICHTMYLWLA
jgi:hypothetical protein